MKESALYKSIFAKGVAQAHADTIHRFLARWLGSVDPSVHDRVATFPDQSTVQAWCDAAWEINDAESARKLLDKILQTPVPGPTEGSSQAA